MPLRFIKSNAKRSFLPQSIVRPSLKKKQERKKEKKKRRVFLKIHQL
jgi:hypothetical protein